jgi:hypothetical protein
VSAIASKINDAAISGITASGASGVLKIFATSFAKSTGSTADGKVILIDGPGTPLSKAGITAGTYFSPQISRGSYVDIPSWLSSDTVAAPSGSVYVKTSVQGNGMNLAVKQYNATAGSFTSLAVPVYENSASAIYNLDLSGGGNGIAEGSIYARYTVSSSNTKLLGARLMFRKAGPMTSVTGSVPSAAFVVGNSFTLQATDLGTTTLGSYTCTLGGTTTADFVAAILAQNISYVTASVGSSGAVTIKHELGGEIILNNVAGTPLTTAGFTTSTTGVSADPATTGLVLSNWTPGGSGTGFQAYTYSFSTPYQAPSDGTLWYYGDAADVDIMINNSGWKGYRNPTSDARGYNLTNTDPSGVIVSASEPTTQTDNTALTAGDLWLDSGDLVNYPSLYRYNGTKFVAIDKTDQTGQNGILLLDRSQVLPH